MEKQVARVILKKCRTYRVGDRRFIRDVPQVIRGDEVDEYRNNGYFNVIMLKSKPADTVPSEKKKPATAKTLTRTEDLDDEDEEETYTPPKKKPIAKAAATAKKSGLLKKR